MMASCQIISSWGWRVEGGGTSVLFILKCQVWPEFGHPILRKSFHRVLRLYAFSSLFLIAFLLHACPTSSYPFLISTQI